MCVTRLYSICFFFFFNDTATTEIYTLSLHDALPIWRRAGQQACLEARTTAGRGAERRCAPRRTRRTARRRKAEAPARASEWTFTTSSHGLSPGPKWRPGLPEAHKEKTDGKYAD